MSLGLCLAFWAAIGRTKFPMVLRSHEHLRLSRFLQRAVNQVHKENRIFRRSPKSVSCPTGVGQNGSFVLFLRRPLGHMCTSPVWWNGWVGISWPCLQLNFYKHFIVVISTVPKRLLTSFWFWTFRTSHDSGTKVVWYVCSTPLTTNEIFPRQCSPHANVFLWCGMLAAHLLTKYKQNTHLLWSMSSFKKLDSSW